MSRVSIRASHHRTQRSFVLFLPSPLRLTYIPVVSGFNSSDPPSGSKSSVVCILSRHADPTFVLNVLTYQGCFRTFSPSAIESKSAATVRLLPSPGQPSR